ncbi:MAG: PAS domain-containing protein, partial [Anaeromyxobacteraceae bacterium]
MAASPDLAALIEEVRDVVFRTDAGGLWTFLNGAWTTVTGWSVAESLGRSFLEYVHPDDRARNLALFEPVIARRKDHCLHQVRYVARDGGVRWIEVHARATFEGDAVVGTTGTLRDVTAYRAAEREFEASRQLFDDGPVIVVRWGEGATSYVTRNVAQLGLSAEDLVAGRVRWSDVVHPDDRARTEAEAAAHVAAGATHFRREYRVVVPDRGARWVEDQTLVLRGEDGRPTSFLGYVMDATERRQLEARMMEMDRMIAVGTLAVGVAHEINNPLAYVIGNLQWASDALATSPAGAPGTLDEVRRALAEAFDGADRVRRIVRDLKALARADATARTPVQLGPVIEAAVSISWSEIHHRARLVRDLAPTPPALANEGKIAQVLVNLLVNAAQAIPEGHPESNEVRVRTFAEGDRVGFEVSDTGAGIAPEHLPRLFDPFFTTKPPGQGTGLGLSISRTTIEGFGGTIAVDSAPGRGARFRVLLPAVQSARAAAAGTAPALARSRVLLVDDEPLVLSALRRLLSRDHDVAVASGGREALEQLKRGARYDAVVCDMMMPDLSGIDLHRAVAELVAAQASRMVFMTGGAFTPDACAFLDRVPNPRFGKP